MAYAASGGFWLFFGQALTYLASIALAVAFANLIEPEKYGNYKYVLTIAGALGTLTLTGLTTAVTRGAAHGHDGTLPYAFRKMLQWSVGVVAGGIALACYYLLNGNQFLGISFIILALLLPIITSTGLYRSYLLGRKDFRRAALYGIVQGALPSLAVLAGILFHVPIIGLVALYFGSSAVLVYVLYSRVRRGIVSTATVDPVAQHLGKHLSILGVLGVIADKLDSILVFQFLGGAQLAMLALATALPDAARGSLKNITSLVLPKFAHKSRDQLKAIIHERTPLFLVGMITIAVVYAALAPWIFKTFFPLYQAVVPLSQVYALIIPFSLVLSSAYFDVQSIVRERYAITVIEITSQLLFTVVGLVYWGLWGVIVARVAARGVKALATQFVMWRS
jgi:O-antigen/teichoic acid export membrane protein